MNFEHGRYEVEVPWKNGRPALPNNYSMALKRLTSTEMKLMKNAEMAKDYHARDNLVVSATGLHSKGVRERVRPASWMFSFSYFSVFRETELITELKGFYTVCCTIANCLLSQRTLIGR